jgi:DNA-binding LacI/PurR family transcriptional regulator
MSTAARLDEALALHRTADIWIFNQDQDAAAAVRWAQERRIEIPARVSVLTLENNPQNYELGISLCEPDWEHAGYLLAHAIIGDFPIEKTSKGFLRTRARVVTKLTTR